MLMRRAPTASQGATGRRKERRRRYVVPSAILFFLLPHFALFDLALLRSLPELGISYGTHWQTPLAGALSMRVLIGTCVAAGLAVIPLLRRYAGRPARSRRAREVLVISVLVQAALTAAELEAYLIEPFRLGTTALRVASPKLDAAAPPLRIVHLTDIHVERTTRRERALVARVNALEPDLIVLTGDYLNLSYLNDERARQDFRWLISQLRAKYGIYAIRGSLEHTVEGTHRLFEGTEVVLLENEHRVLAAGGQKLALIGVACSHVQQQDAERLREAMAGLPPDVFRLLLFHSPDLAHQAALADIDLYLAGHTHGGQIRAPVYGAIVTSSHHGKRFEMGRYRIGDGLLYVSRGLGMEGSFAPRARFLCPPEVVSISLGGE